MPSGGSPPITSRIAGISRSSLKRSNASCDSHTSAMIIFPSANPAVWTIIPSGGFCSTPIVALTLS